MNQPIRITLLTNAPTHYHAPLYREIAVDPRVRFNVVFLSNGGLGRHGAGLGEPTIRDTGLTGGFDHSYVARASVNPLGGTFFYRDHDVVRQVFRDHPEVVWIHGYNSSSHQQVAWASKLRGVPLLVRDDQTAMFPRPAWKQAAKFVGLRSMLRNSRALYVGEANKDWFIKYGVPQSRLFYMPYAIDNAVFRAHAWELAGSRNAIRTQFGITDPGIPLILAVCRLSPEKNLELLVDAYARLRKHTAAELLIVGSGEQEAQLKAQVRRLEVDGVHWAGFLKQSQLPHAYVAADVFVLPSVSETWGLVVNEAMNFGLPLVVSDMVGCSRDLVEHGENGFVFSSGDAADLLANLEQLVLSKELRKTMGTASAERISAWNYDAAREGLMRAVADAVGVDRWRQARG